MDLELRIIVKPLLSPSFFPQTEKAVAPVEGCIYLFIFCPILRLLLIVFPLKKISSGRISSKITQCCSLMEKKKKKAVSQ